MNEETVKEYLMNKKGVTEEKPFNFPVPVFKVGSKIFATINIHEQDRQSINLKYPKNKISALRAIFEEIQPGYHMNKEHWNTVYIDKNLDDEFIMGLIDISYNLVFRSLAQKEQKSIKESESTM